MKLRICAILMIAAFGFSACQKDSTAPLPTKSQNNIAASNLTPVVPIGGAGLTDTTDIKGFLKVKLAKDNVNTDDIVICFNPKAKGSYVKGEDAPYFQGYGLVSLSSLSSDRISLTINTLPLLQQGVSIALNVNAKTDGQYQLKLDSVNSIPSTYKVWLMDHYKKDSVVLVQSASYSFNLSKADTSSFGSNRFSLVVR